MGSIRRRHYKVDTFPREVRDELARRFLAGETYDRLVAWAESQGHKVGRSSVGRWGDEFKQNLQELQILREQSHALVSEVAGKPTTELNEVAEQTAVQGLLELLLALRRLRASGAVEDKKALLEIVAGMPRIGQALARLGASASGRERVKLEFHKQFAADVAKTAEQARAKLTAAGTGKEAVSEVVDSILHLGK